MANKLALANEAIRAGRRDEAIGLVMEVIEAIPDQPAGLYRELLNQLYQAGRYDEGESWAARAIERHPDDFDLWNARGVLLRRAGRPREALAALERASVIRPQSLPALINRGNVLNDLKDGPAAEAVFAELLRRDSANADYHRALGRALMAQKKNERAAECFRQAVAARRNDVDAWLDLSGLMSVRLDHQGGLALLDEALAACGPDWRLLKAKAVSLRRSSDPKAAEAFLMSLLPARENEAWLHHQLAGAIGNYDRPRADRHFARAVALEPDNVEYRLAKAEGHRRSRDGDEGANLDLAYAELKAVLPRLPDTPNALKIASEILIRLADYEAAEALGSFADLGRRWAEDGLHTALLEHLARVRAPEDRDELVRQHRIWGDAVAEDVARIPITRPKGPRPSSKIRLGIMSSDLRAHAVAYFAQPLFEFRDRERFEVHAYSWFEGDTVDPTQAYLMERTDVFRWERGLADREAAQLIADDRIDLLLDLGGTTHMNRVSIMAFRPAPLQASWLGYPHSVGLEAIDYFVTDPQVLPPRRELMIETPLLMPKTWIALGKMAFLDIQLINPVPPVKRNGFITFGTANNAYKYSAELLAAWARIMGRVPGSRFLFLRPEGGSAVFRENVLAIFARHGITPDRVRFDPVRGQHVRLYNEIDISLDTFPLTGGTTTCESLWMGVPVVTLVGEAMFERQSYSLLVNAGLADLAAWTLDEYADIAVALAEDVDRIAELRRGLRDRLKEGPLGQTEQFARDFYDLMARAVEGGG